MSAAHDSLVRRPLKGRLVCTAGMSPPLPPLSRPKQWLWYSIVGTTAVILVVVAIVADGDRWIPLLALALFLLLAYFRRRVNLYWWTTCVGYVTSGMITVLYIGERFPSASDFAYSVFLLLGFSGAVAACLLWLRRLDDPQPLAPADQVGIIATVVAASIGLATGVANGVDDDVVAGAFVLILAPVVVMVARRAQKLRDKADELRADRLALITAGLPQSHWRAKGLKAMARQMEIWAQPSLAINAGLALVAIAVVLPQSVAAWAEPLTCAGIIALVWLVHRNSPPSAP